MTSPVTPLQSSQHCAVHAVKVAIIDNYVTTVTAAQRVSLQGS